MLNRVLRFKNHLSVHPLDDEHVIVLGEREQFLLRGRPYALVAPLLDGRRTTREILEALDGKAFPPDLLYALMSLEERGYLVEATEELAPEVAAFWLSQGIDAHQAAQRLAAAPVAVHALGGLAAPPLVAALQGAGIRVEDGAPIDIVWTPDYLASELAAWNQRALDQKRRWALVKLEGSVPWIGPVLRPGEGPCWACLAHRLRANRPVQAYLERRTGSAAPLIPPRAALPTSVQLAAHFTALTLARWIIQDGACPLSESLLTLDPVRFTSEAHPVVRRPQCPVCGDPERVKARALAPVVLESRPKRFTEDGGHRCAPPEQIVSLLERQISPITGVVASIGPVPGRDHPLRPTYGTAYRVCPTSPVPSFQDFDRTCMGKGRTASQARASALSETIERYSALFQGDEARVRARFVDLGEEALHPDSLQGYSEAQFQARAQANAGVTDDKRLIPLPFDPRAEIDWTPAWSLTRGCRRWVPTAYCYQHVPVPPEERFCYMNPNGHAAGLVLEEAILQGFFELVERDAIALWWYNGLRRPRVELSSFDEPYFASLEAHYAGLGYQLWVLDLTNDLEIPTFAALSQAQDTGRFCIGFGCHVEARLGVQRALTEHNQLFDPARASPAPWDDSALPQRGFLTPDGTAAARRREDYRVTAHADLMDDVRACVDRAARAGLEVVVLDQTRPDLGLCAAKVMVPGLRHFWPRFGPGRLYQVPVSLGWLERPLAESQLNPVPLYL